MKAAPHAAPSAHSCAANADAPACLYRRRIEITRPNLRTATAWMEDDFHHFGVEIEHLAGRITNVRVESKRAPFATCPVAAAKLVALVGQTLVVRASEIGAFIDIRAQCTHMADLAGLAIAAAASGTQRRSYEIAVTDRHPRPSSDRPHAGRCLAALHRDGSEILRWHIEDQTVLLHDGSRVLTEGFRRWTEDLPPPDAEAALVLRRAVGVAAGRVIELDGIRLASELGLPPVCHTYSADQAPVARRNAGSRRDFSTAAETLLADTGSMAF